eukprot:279192-Chlamydomonas_euryale.AAC.1
MRQVGTEEGREDRRREGGQEEGERTEGGREGQERGEARAWVLGNKVGVARAESGDSRSSTNVRWCKNCRC